VESNAVKEMVVSEVKKPDDPTQAAVQLETKSTHVVANEEK